MTILEKPRVTKPCTHDFCNHSTLADRIYRSAGSLSVIYNQKPLAQGHSLVVAKRHVEGLLDLTLLETLELFRIMQATMPALLHRYADDKPAYDIKIRSGEASG